MENGSWVITCPALLFMLTNGSTVFSLMRMASVAFFDGARIPEQVGIVVVHDLPGEVWAYRKCDVP